MGHTDILRINKEGKDAVFGPESHSALNFSNYFYFFFFKTKVLGVETFPAV